MNDGIRNVLSYRLKTSNAQTTSKCPKMIRVRVSGRKKVIGRTGRAPVAWKSLLFSFSLIVESEGKKKAGRVLKMSRCVLCFFSLSLSLYVFRIRPSSFPGEIYITRFDHCHFASSLQLALYS